VLFWMFSMTFPYSSAKKSFPVVSNSMDSDVILAMDITSYKF